MKKTNTFWKDFKAFISKGNVIDLAVAVIIGAAFGKIVTSLVNDIIMPLISLAVGGLSVADWKWIITPAVYNSDGVLVTAETALRYGTFLQTIFDFLIIAFFVFLALRILMASQKKLTEFGNDILAKAKKKLKKGQLPEETPIVIVEEVAPAPKEEPKQETTDAILKDIRDLLKQNNTNKKE